MAIKKFSKTALNNLKLSAVRFPLPVIFALLCFLLALANIYNLKMFPEAREERLVAIFITGFFWFGAAKLYAEGHGVSRAKVILSAALIFVVMALYIYFAHYGLSIHNLIISGVIALVMGAPFIGRKTKDADFYAFNYHLWLSFIYSVIFGVVLCLGACAVVATINELFSVKIHEDVYGIIWYVTAIFLAPYYALSGVPNKFTAKGDEVLPKGIRFILSYVLVPLGLIYFLILYAYVIKIIIQWELPTGGLAYMICGFGAAGTITQLAIYPIRNKGGLVSIFHKYFCKVFLPLIVVLFVAIGVRISEYGVTESRYAIALAGVWFVCTTAIYLFRRDDYSMKFGPAILAALFLLSSFGPWGAVHVSERSQVGRLEALLVKNNMLKDGKFIKPAASDKITDSESISSIIYYLARTEKLDAIRPWFPKDSAIHKDIKMYEGYRVLESMGLQRDYVQYDNSKYLSYSHNRERKSFSVAGYDHYISNISPYDNPYSYSGPTTNLNVSLESSKLTLNFEGKEKLEIDMAPLFAKLKDAADPSGDGMMDLEVEGNNYKLKLLFTYLSGKDENGKLEVTAANFNMLVKDKK